MPSLPHLTPNELLSKDKLDMTSDLTIDDTRMPLTSADVLGERMEWLKELFPEAFVEGQIDFDQLRNALGDSVGEGRERYGLSWAGKADAIRAIQAPSVGTLVPSPEESVNFDTTENLFIEGDNLEVLKLLQKSYYGKVKMIYIDPPYNTGGEFIYPDNFREGLEESVQIFWSIRRTRHPAIDEYRDVRSIPFAMARHDVFATIFTTKSA